MPECRLNIHPPSFTMRFLLFVVVTFLPVLVTAQSLVLSKDGKTEYVIVLPAEPTAVEQTAAKELKEHLDSVTGADFAVISESDAKTSQPQILVGNSKRVKELLPKIDITKIPYDGIVIKSVDKNLVLVGHPQRGTLYAVNTFLEDAVGVRWWTSIESFLPKKPTLEIPVQNVEHAPHLIFRETSYRDATDPVFATRLRCNGNRARITPEYGGHHQFYHWVHSFFPLLPPGKYFDKHPEWYSEINGQRNHERAQLCLTNDKMRAELTKNAIEGLRKNPDATFISISQNDWAGYCTCEKCKAVDDEEGGPSGTLIRFVNNVAEDIEKEFPNVWVETLAYQYTRKPPKLVKPRKNVVIRFCTIECSFVQPLGEGEQNKALREDIQGWNKIVDSLFVWDYTVNFSAYMLPHPNHRVLAPNVRFFVDHSVIGLYEQGDSYCAAGDFVRMKAWVLSHLMWNPSLDENKLYDEFLNGYYGPKYGPMLKEYLKILHDRAEQSGVYLRCFMTSTNGWLDYLTWVKASFSLAIKEDDFEKDVFFKRYERETLPILLVLLKGYYAFQRQAQLTGTFLEGSPIASPPNEFASALDMFFNLCKEHNVKAYRERDTPKLFADFEANLRAQFGPSAAPPEFCKNLPKTSWFDVQEFEFYVNTAESIAFRVDDEKASNKRAVRMPGDHNRWATRYALDDWGTAQSQTDGEQRYRLYAAVRCDAKDGIEGPAMSLGIYDYENRKSVVSKTLSVANIRGPEYHWIDVGTLTLRPQLSFWFAPPKRPGEVDAVYIDRIVAVREQ